MNITIFPTKLNGKITAITSKSALHRALFCAALYAEKTTLQINTLSEDTLTTIDCLKNMGAKIEVVDNNIFIEKIKVEKSYVSLNCNESGTTARLIIPIAVALFDKVTICGKGKLPTRGFLPIIKTLRENGCEVDSETLPMTITKRQLNNSFSISALLSSQFLSGLLLTIPLLENAKITLTEDIINSSGYVDMTIEMLEKFGVLIQRENNVYVVKDKNLHKQRSFQVEGDWSNSAFWVVANSLGSKIEILGLDNNSRQKDRLIESFCKQIMQEDCVIDAKDIPDLVPILAVLATQSNHMTTITNIARLRQKESDRITTTYNMLNSLGVKIQYDDNNIYITQKNTLKGGIVCGENDHRIVMATAIASTVCENAVEIIDCEAINKSYPDFFAAFESLGGKYVK